MKFKQLYIIAGLCALAGCATSEKKLYLTSQEHAVGIATGERYGQTVVVSKPGSLSVFNQYQEGKHIATEGYANQGTRKNYVYYKTLDGQVIQAEMPIVPPAPVKETVQTKPLSNQPVKQEVAQASSPAQPAPVKKEEPKVVLVQEPTPVKKEEPKVVPVQKPTPVKKEEPKVVPVQKSTPVKVQAPATQKVESLPVVIEKPAVYKLTIKTHMVIQGFEQKTR